MAKKSEAEKPPESLTKKEVLRIFRARRRSWRAASKNYRDENMRYNSHRMAVLFDRAIELIEGLN